MTAPRVFAALLRRDWLIAVSYRATFVLELGSIVLFLALFFYLGRLVNDGELATEEGLQADYFAFAAVGLAVFRIVQISLGTFTRKLREEQTTGTFETLLAAPVTPALIVLASASYDLLRGALSGLLALALAIVVFGVELHTDPGSVAIAVLALIAFLGLFAAFAAVMAAVTVVLKRATALLGVSLAALGLLGGVYFPVEVLPEALEVVAEALPFTWGLDVLRAALLGGDVDPAKLAGLLASTAVILPAALGGFAAAVRRARRAGTLAEY